MVLGMWLIIIFVLLYEPIFGYFDYQKFKMAIKEKADVRSRYYLKVMTGLWIPTIIIFIFVLLTELNLKDIGMTFPSIDTNTMGTAITYSIFVVASLYLLSVLYFSIGYHFSEKIRTKFIQAKEKELSTESFSDILPVTSKEKKVWNYVSLTAAVTEEIIYRGFLIFALSYIFPELSIWLVIIFSSILFGLAHTYQGILGVIRTTIVGIIFSCIYIGLGSIIPLIILHFLIDYLAMLGDSETQEEPL